MKATHWAIGITSIALVLTMGTANAGFIDTFDGNDCGKVMQGEEKGFSSCNVNNLNPAYNDAPVLIKFDSGFKDDDFTYNTKLFTKAEAEAFADKFSFETEDGGKTGTWTYNFAEGDPIITYFVAKGGNYFNLFSTDTPGSGTWSTPINGNGNNIKLYDLSHLTFYGIANSDNGGHNPDETNIPEPVSLLLFGAGLAGLGWTRRRKNA